MADMKQKAEIQQRIREIEALKKQANAIDPNSMQALIDLNTMEQKLAEIEAQGEIDVDVVKAKGKNKLDAIEADGRTSRKRKFGQAIGALFRGFGDTTKDDIAFADNAEKLAKKKLAKSKVKYTKEMLDKATELLIKQFESHKYTAEQQDKIAESIIQEILRQSENAK